MEGCIFCKIINKEIPSDFIHEDDVSVSFLDINPVNIGHTLLVPREHHENIFDIPEELLMKVSVTAKKLARALRKGLSADGVNITSNNGQAAGQLVSHAHTHIIPRYDNDGFTHWKGKRGYQDGEAKEVVEKIKSNIP